VLCFLLYHDIRFEPRNTRYLVVDLRSLGRPAQSVSENAVIQEMMRE
jgi:hypothetical protein